jgi:sec-independent protein translocase protein TatA
VVPEALSRALIKEAAMLGMIGPETLLIVVVLAALLMGGKKIPEMARGLGRAKTEFQKGLQEGAQEGKAENEADQPQAQSESRPAEPEAKSS